VAIDAATGEPTRTGLRTPGYLGAAERRGGSPQNENEGTHRSSVIPLTIDDAEMLERPVRLFLLAIAVAELAWLGVLAYIGVWLF
jgi:hypothetical protein